MSTRFEALRAVTWGSALVVLSLSLIVAIGFVLRLVGAGDRSLWHDEIYALRTVIRPTASLISWPLVDNGNMYLFYWIAHAWAQLLPAIPPVDELALRALPIALSTLAIPVTYLVGRDVAQLLFSDDRTRTIVPLLAALSLAISPVAVLYGQDFRAYSLQLLLMAVSLLSMLTAYRSTATRYRYLPWVTYVIVTSVLGYTHMLSVPSIFAQITGGFLLTLSPQFRRLRKPLVTSAIIITLVHLPLAAAVLTAGAGQIGWIAPITLGRFTDVLATLIGAPQRYLTPLSAVAAGGTVVLMLLAVRQAVASIRTARPILALILFPLFFTLIAGAMISVLGRPLWVERYYSHLALPIALLTGSGAALALQWARTIRVTWRRPAAFGVVTLALGLTLSGTIASSSAVATRETFQDWKGASALLSAECVGASTVQVYTSKKLMEDFSLYGVDTTAHLLLGPNDPIPAFKAGETVCLIARSYADEREKEVALLKGLTSLGRVIQKTERFDRVDEWWVTAIYLIRVEAR